MILYIHTDINFFMDYSLQHCISYIAAWVQRYVVSLFVYGYLCHTAFGELLSSIRAALQISVEDFKNSDSVLPALYQRLRSIVIVLLYCIIVVIIVFLFFMYGVVI